MNNQELLIYAKDYLKECYLCRINSVDYLVLFKPNKEYHYLYPESDLGEDRLFIYGVCNQCVNEYGREKVSELVEDKLMGETCKNEKK